MEGISVVTDIMEAIAPPEYAKEIGRINIFMWNPLPRVVNIVNGGVTDFVWAVMATEGKPELFPVSLTRFFAKHVQDVPEIVRIIVTAPLPKE